MSRRNNYDTSYSLEHILAQSIERVSDNIAKQRRLKRDILKLRKQRRQLESVPDEVRQWYEEVEGMEDEEEV